MFAMHTSCTAKTYRPNVSCSIAIGGLNNAHEKVENTWRHELMRLGQLWMLWPTVMDQHGIQQSLTGQKIIGNWGPNGIPECCKWPQDGVCPPVIRNSHYPWATRWRFCTASCWEPPVKPGQSVDLFQGSCNSTVGKGPCVYCLLRMPNKHIHSEQGTGPQLEMGCQWQTMLFWATVLFCDQLPRGNGLKLSSSGPLLKNGKDTEERSHTTSYLILITAVVLAVQS